jgi:hypothetical protein
MYWIGRKWWLAWWNPSGSFSYARSIRITWPWNVVGEVPIWVRSLDGGAPKGVPKLQEGVPTSRKCTSTW